MNEYPPAPTLRNVIAPPVELICGTELVVDAVGGLEGDGYDHSQLAPKKFFAHAGGGESK